ncbi:Sigma factor RpoE negative regulatory protein RseB precursor [hydrothermal vent metagenome]|uniref:Sigma factor RpoE negative regulatory protein RseB n=1 Tax=hydrothermal vent metagenome TaxID=652676 RepID=A0A3B0ZSX7_9ZZZZ
MKNKFLVFIIGLVFFVGGINLAAASDKQPATNKQVEFWLAKMHRASHMVNYQGIFVYGQQNNLSSMKIVHSTDGSSERERLLSLDGTGREVIRTKNSVTCILPDSQSVMVEKKRPKSNFPPAFPVKINELSKNYHFYLLGKEMVAGQTAQKIIINPKDQYRYGHTLWIDEKSGLLLKTYLVDERKQVVEQFMFTQIDYMDKVPDELLKPSISGENFTWYESGTAHKGDEVNQPSQWRVKQLPAGFNAEMNRKHIMPRSGAAMDHLVFSDGLTSISVFIEKHSKKEDQIVGHSRMGAINACGRALQDGLHVTVVGAVTHAAVKMICDSVYLKD